MGFAATPKSKRASAAASSFDHTIVGHWHRTDSDSNSSRKAVDYHAGGLQCQKRSQLVQSKQIMKHGQAGGTSRFF